MPAIISRRTSPFASPRDWFDRELSRYVDNWFDGETPTAAYPVDVYEDDNHITVEAEMPGFTKGQVNITLEKGVLHIAAERKAEQRDGASHLNERRYTRIARSFSLPVPVDEDNVEASLENGVLTLKLSKREEVRPRRIEVK